MEGLRDIKGIVAVNEYSFEILLAIIIVAVAVLALLFYFYKKRRKRRYKPSKKEIALKNLKNIDFNDIKNTVYTFTIEGSLWVDENNTDDFKEIEASLLQYKYRKEVPSIDEGLKQKIESFVKGLK